MAGQCPAWHVEQYWYRLETLDVPNICTYTS